METKNIVLWLRGYAAGLKHVGDEYGCDWINLAADRLDELAGLGDKPTGGENVYPDWYKRLGELDYIYQPECDGEAWYRADAVWACIEETKDEQEVHTLRSQEV